MYYAFVEYIMSQSVYIHICVCVCVGGGGGGGVSQLVNSLLECVLL